MGIYTPFRANAIGNNIIVPAQAGKVIAVTGVFFQASLLSTFVLRDGTSGSNLTGQMTFAVGGGLNLPDPGSGIALFETSAGNPLVIQHSLLGDVGGAIVFQYV